MNRKQLDAAIMKVEDRRSEFFRLRRQSMGSFEDALAEWDTTREAKDLDEMQIMRRKAGMPKP